MTIEFLGAAREVTGSCTLINACGKRILVDCGMEQGPDTYENSELPVSPSQIDIVLLTHAHIDHSGKLPALTAGGFSGPIYATGATVSLCGIMLMDSAHIQESEALWRNRKAKRAGEGDYLPPYTTEDVQKTLPLFVPCGYNREYEVASGVMVRFIDAGHLLGSAGIEITITENGVTKTVLFSGDVGNTDRPLIRDPQKPEKADIVIIESTYGDRLHGERKDYTSQLASLIQRTFDRGGNVVIPAFAVGRTQEMLWLLREIKEKEMVRNHPDFQVWVDSPLAIEATGIYGGELLDYYDDETLRLLAKGINPLRFNGLHMSLTSQESMKINADTTPKVIISASGMCEAGRIRHHLKHNLWRNESSVLFVGYQAVGTPGRVITEGAKFIKLFGEEIRINAEIVEMEGISGHADKDMLIDWLKNIKKPPELVFVNHGNDYVCEAFAKEINTKLGIDAVAPFCGSRYDLETGACIETGNTVRLQKEKKAEKRRAASAAYDRLLKAGQRLMAVIERNRGSANKDLAKFTSQINDLCSKWER